MKRFILFGFPQYYPAGGMGDVVGDFNTLDEAIAAARVALVDLYGGSFDLLDMDARAWIGMPSDLRRQ